MSQLSSTVAQIRSSLTLRNNNLNYQSTPSGFNGILNTSVGPTPGAFLASLSGTDANLSALTQMGGYAFIGNYDVTNYVTVGIYDPLTHGFYPMLELMPGEYYVVRLSRWLTEELGSGAGSGTDVEGTGKTLRFKANGSPCYVLLEAFNR